MEWLFDFTSSMYQGGVVRAAFTLMSQDNVEDIFVATFVFATQYHFACCRTSVKISFPDLRNELFVNILGYKEPNLIHLWRCKVFSLFVTCQYPRI